MIQCVLQTIVLLCECADIFNRNMKSGWQGLTFCSITVINMFTVHIAVCNLFTCISELLSASCSIKWWQVHEHFRELEIRNKLSASSRIKKKVSKSPFRCQDICYLWVAPLVRAQGWAVLGQLKMLELWASRS